MKIATSPSAILEAMKEHELAIAGLYEVYSEAFPECEDYLPDIEICCLADFVLNNNIPKNPVLK